MTDAATLEPRRAEPSGILSQPERILLYGPGGTGKTFTASTAPEPLWFLTPGGENEVKTAFSKDFISRHGRRDIFITSVRESREQGQMSDNPSGFDDCCIAVDRFLEWNDREGMEIKTIVIDNATVLEEYMMNKAIQAEYVLAGSKEKTTLKRERDLGIRKPADSTWGGAQSLMDRWANWLIELPFHLVFVAHDYESWKSPGGNSRERELVSVKPLFVGQQRTSIPNKFDNVWYATVMGGGRSRTFNIQTTRDNTIEAKTRVGGILDEYERDPNITEIIEQFSQYAQTLEEE